MKLVKTHHETRQKEWVNDKTSTRSPLFGFSLLVFFGVLVVLNVCTYISRDLVVLQSGVSFVFVRSFFACVDLNF